MFLETWKQFRNLRNKIEILENFGKNLEIWKTKIGNQVKKFEI